MAFAASQFGPLIQIPAADPDTDMLSDAPEEGHDFDIDVDAMSEAENQDVDFVLDGGNAAANETAAEAVDQEMLEATTEQKTIDAPMSEPDHGPDEIMDAVVPLVPVNDGQMGDGLRAPFEAYGANQNVAVVADSHDNLLSSSQQYSGDGVNQPNHSTLVPEPSALADIPLESAVPDPKAVDEDNNLPSATEPGVQQDIQPNDLHSNPSRDPQAHEEEAENPPPHVTLGSTSSDPTIPSSDHDRTLVTDESIAKNPNQEPENSLENQDDSHGGEYTEHENADGEHNAANKPNSSECAALVSYAGSKLSLFPPAVDGLPESYLVDDASIAENALHELFIACRKALGANIGEESQLQLVVPGLQLIFEEDSVECSIITLFQICDIHHRLNKNDGVESHIPLPLTLKTRPRMSARLRELTEAISASKGYSSFISELLPEDNDENDLAEDENDEDSPDGDGQDSDNENPSEIDNDEENQGAYDAVNESATERDTNSERKTASNTDDEHEDDSNSRTGDHATADLGDNLEAYSENEDEYSDDPSGDAGPQDVAHASIELKGDAARHENQGLDEESEAASDGESPEEFNFAEENDDEESRVNDVYAGPSFSGKSTAEGSGVYLGAHEATLNDEEEYAQLDDWLVAPEEENFGFANDSNPDALDAVNGSAQLGNEVDTYGNDVLEYGGEWGNEVEARISSPSKLNSDSPLGKRAREDSVDDAEPDSDQEAKRVRST